MKATSAANTNLTTIIAQQMITAIALIIIDITSSTKFGWFRFLTRASTA